MGHRHGSQAARLTSVTASYMPSECSYLSDGSQLAAERLTSGNAETLKLQARLGAVVGGQRASDVPLRVKGRLGSTRAQDQACSFWVRLQGPTANSS